jgi:hypothetical protein
MLVVHESTDDIRPGRDDPGFAGRDTSQPRCPVRSPVARGVAGSGGDELPGSSEGPGRFPRDGGKLGAPFRAAWIRRVERGRANWEAQATNPEGNDEGRDSATAVSGRLRAAGASVGWTLVVGFSAEAVRGDFEGAPVPTPLSPIGFPAPQTAPGDSPSRPATAGGSKKNSSDSPSTLTSTSGRWTKSISSSTVAGAVCGFRLKSGTRFVAMRRHANSSVTLAPSGSEMDGWSPPSLKGASMPKPAGPSFVSCGAGAGATAAAPSSSSTTPGITTPRFTPNGAAFKSPASSCCSSRLTAQTSTPSSESGNFSVSSGSTIATFQLSPSSPNSSTVSSRPGRDPTPPFASSARSDNMFSYLRRCV